MAVELDKGKGKVGTEIGTSRNKEAIDSLKIGKIAIPTPEQIVKERPYLEGVVNSKTTFTYSRNGDLLATNPHFQICLTDKQLSFPVMVNRSNGKPQIVIGPSKLPLEVVEDCVNYALGDVCGGDYSKL